MSNPFKNSDTQHTLWKFAIYALSLLAWSGLDFFFRRPRKVVGEEIKIRGDEIKFWFIGHSSFLINVYGKTILTDPVFTESLPFPRRLVAAGYRASDMPAIDLLLLSHAHMDHWNKKSLQRIAGSVGTVVIPRNCEDLLSGIGFKNVAITEWGEKAEVGPFTVRAFKPNHWGRRYPWEKVDRRYHSYVVTRGEKSIFFCGDSGATPMFFEVGKLYDIEAALLPIGCYLPPPFRVNHMNPDDAVRAFCDLRARHLIPMHFGSFRLSLESFDEPPKFLKRSAAAADISGKVHILENGQSFML